MLTKRMVWGAVLVLLAVQTLLMAYAVRRESLTFDEDNHMFAGYMMWKTGDYGLNPEHPPLVKLLATLPLLGRDLWIPTLKGRDFKTESYLDGRDFLARNDGASQHLVFQMRLAAGLLALALSLTVFLTAREFFGDMAGLAAMVLVVFDPNILAHSALVTTDIGVSLFFLLSVLTFYRYVKQPSLIRLALAALAAGLLLATKHSGILLAPMFILLITWEIATTTRADRARTATRLAGAFAAIVVAGCAVLWAFYGFRFAARPVGLPFPTVAEYVQPLSHFNQAALLFFASFHLLPASYLIGMADVKRMAEFYPTYALGHVYAHGIWWYFPAVILIKTTLGFLGLLATAAFAVFAGRLRKYRELAFALIPAGFYLLVAIAAGIDIGARHILPFYTFLFIVAGGGIAAMAPWRARGRRWAWMCALLLTAHVVSSLSAFPNTIAYANEAWGGPANVHNLLSDANADWAQQLYQVKDWQDAHPSQECWFAYFAQPEINPETYGIRCHHLPTIDTFWLGGADIIPPTIEGNVFISAGDWSGCEWPSGRLNPYIEFQAIKPVANIDYGVLAYQGKFDVHQAAALSRAVNAFHLLWTGNAAGALPLARDAVTIDPNDLMSQSALGDAAAATGNKDEARKAWEAAIVLAKQLEPDAQPSYVPDLEGKLKKL